MLNTADKYGSCVRQHWQKYTSVWSYLTSRILSAAIKIYILLWKNKDAHSMGIKYGKVEQVILNFYDIYICSCWNRRKPLPSSSLSDEKKEPFLCIKFITLIAKGNDSRREYWRTNLTASPSSFSIDNDKKEEGWVLLLPHPPWSTPFIGQKILKKTNHKFRPKHHNVGAGIRLIVFRFRNCRSTIEASVESPTATDSAAIKVQVAMFIKGR